VSYHDESQRKLSRAQAFQSASFPESAEPPALLERRGCFLVQAVKDDKAAADAIFEDYLAGKLSEKLVSISRLCVSGDSADQAGSSKREIEMGGAGRWSKFSDTGRWSKFSDDAFTALS
jgi:hypothetical protein